VLDGKQPLNNREFRPGVYYYRKRDPESPQSIYLGYLWSEPDLVEAVKSVRDDFAVDSATSWDEWEAVGPV
jgi:hypothetical protein